MPTESLGQILLRRTDLTPQNLDAALRTQQIRRPRPGLGDLLIEQGQITPEQLTAALAEQWGLTALDTIHPDHLDQNLLAQLPLDFLKQHRLLPLTVNQQRAVALADPLTLEPYDALCNLLHQRLPRLLCPAPEIDKAISRAFYHDLAHRHADQPEPLDLLEPEPNLTAPDQQDLLNIANQAPIVQLVNTILFQAVARRASDIHFEPYEDQLRVRFRVDGILHDAFSPPRHQAAALVSRLKIMANLDIAERRLPQDGQSRLRLGQRELDLRVSTIPTAGGERVVLRLLDRGGPGLDLEQLGFDPKYQDQFRNAIHAPHGIVLITGPTGSGKTTTLYCAISELNNHERNILTVEDPIEYRLPGVGQTQVKPKIDLTFANCLRHILRQDPDVIMIGEIRDRETAEIAIHASLTGHLVLSTLHTNDAPSAATRLVEMGVEPYLVSSSLLAVMAQRLVRSICPNCKTPCSTEVDLQTLFPDTNLPAPGPAFFTGQGCEQCLNTGYLGRTGIFELLTIDDTIRDQIVHRAPAHHLAAAARQNGMQTLRHDGLKKAQQGITSLEEVLRVTRDTNSTEKQNAHA